VAISVGVFIKCSVDRPESTIRVPKQQRDSIAPSIDKITFDQLRDSPLTIVFRKVAGHPPPAKPSSREWSINSAGDTELITEIFPRWERQKLTIPAERLAEFRQVLLDEQFQNFKEWYGIRYVDGGWDSLTIVSGDRIKSVRIYGVWGWAKHWEANALAEAARSGRVWLKIVEIVDPEAKYFTGRHELSEAIKTLKR
jgi:hypothetical protein